MTDTHADDATDPDVWRKRLERQRDSLMTLDEYAAEIGVPASTLRKWRQRLAGRVIMMPPTAAGPAPDPVRCANPQCAQLFIPNRHKRDHRYCSTACRVRCGSARWYRRVRGGGEP